MRCMFLVSPICYVRLIFSPHAVSDKEFIYAAYWFAWSLQHQSSRSSVVARCDASYARVLCRVSHFREDVPVAFPL